MLALSSASSAKPKAQRRAEIIGWGMCAPQRVMTNQDLAEMVATSDEWIRSRTGIAQRHVASEGESTAQLAIEAARAALETADANPREIDLIIVATATPDVLLAPTACLVQNALGAIHAGAFDLGAGCSGFVYALTMGHQAIASGEHELVLVIGADTLTRAVDWQDRATCVLFGDGAGAVVLRAAEGPAGILGTALGADGSGQDLLYIPAGGSALPASPETVQQRRHYIQMNGQEVFRFATRIIADATEEAVKKAGLTMDQVDLIIPHQANQRIISAAAKLLKVSEERFVVNLQDYGNTSAASVPIALCEALHKQRIQPGQHIVMVGFGAGLTWAAVALRWSMPAEAKVPAYRNWWRWLLYRWAKVSSFGRQTVRHAMEFAIRKMSRGN